MKRARRESDDSLDLLLDTICNMFGTIIFVALIAALLALSSTAGRTETSLASIDVERDRHPARHPHPEHLRRLAHVRHGSTMPDAPRAARRARGR